MEPFLIIVGGLLGSSHCVGMCGGFAVQIAASSTTLSHALRRQWVYSLGRIVTYVFLGTLAGAFGQQLIEWLPELIHTAAILCVFAGVLLFVQGAISAGLFPQKGTTATNCIAPVFRSFLSSASSWNVLIAGLLTGFLPCGLVYAFLAYAMSSGHALGGLAVMGLFGIGTVPVMVMTGMGAAQLSFRSRTKILRIAAVCVMLTGLVTIYRGVAFLYSPTDTRSPCPFCVND